MSKSFRPWNPEQRLLLPPSPVNWLPANHLVFFLFDLPAELDLQAIHAIYRQKDPRGEKAYDPRMMVVLLPGFIGRLAHENSPVAASDLISFINALPDCRMRRGVRFSLW